MQTSKSIFSIVSRLFSLWRTIGTLQTLHSFTFRLARILGTKLGVKIRLQPRLAKHSLVARLHGSSDLDVYRQIFIEQEYAPLRGLEGVSVVLDLGANVGYSSAYFLSCFRGSRLIAVEPDDSNETVCRENLTPYGDRALLLHGAVWATPAKLSLTSGVFGDGREWATQVAQPAQGSDGDVQAWDLNSLIDMAGVDSVDLLKIDIERSEIAVFGECAEKWLPKIRNICIELHGSDCEEVFFKALAGFHYELEHSGELTILKNIQQKPERGITQALSDAA